MSEQYVATDSREGLQVAVTGDFPEETADRVRIARTTTLFTRLMATILGTADQEERRARFRAVETQLEVAEALISGDGARVRDLMRDTLQQMGISDEQLEAAERELRERLAELGHELPGGPLGELFGAGGTPDGPGDEEPGEPPGSDADEPPDRRPGPGEPPPAAV